MQGSREGSPQAARACDLLPPLLNQQVTVCSPSYVLLTLTFESPRPSLSGQNRRARASVGTLIL